MNHIRAVIFDWAGTVIDHGSLAPMNAFVETFAEFGVALTVAQARGPMGMAKRPHIAALARLPEISSAWERRYGRTPNDDDIDALYAAFLPRNLASVAAHADLIPGVAELARELRAAGIGIGSSTGYTHDIMEKILPRAAEQGFAPDSVVCTGDTAEGRPSPLMFYKGLLDLGAWPAWCTVKVDDTTVGVAEGVNAGAWAVGVAVTGNLFGLSLAETRALSPEEHARRRAEAQDALHAAGAHYVVDSVADLLPVLARIDGRLARGDRP
jgi:phosphonoacetaldehyde hydrolase